jgi:hypothetical protein
MKPVPPVALTRLGCVLLIAVATIGSARAQLLNTYIPSSLAGFDVAPGVTVTSRLHPEYDPLTIRLGDWVIEPRATQGIGYDDNVLGTANKQGSLLIDTEGSLRTTYDSSGNHLEFGANVDRFGYPDLPNQSYTNWSAGGGWSYELDRDNVLGVGYTHFGLDQNPVGIGAIGLVQPVPYHVDAATLSYKAVRGPWTFVPLFNFAATRFDSSADSGVNLGVAGLDRNVETGSLETFYEFAPGRSVVLVVRGTTAQYLQGQPRPNYDDVSALTGLDIDLTGLLRFRGLIGYETRDYHNSAFQNHAAPVLEGTFIWTPTGLTTVTASVLRRIEDANESIQTGYTYTQASLVVDHEYLRNVLLQGRVWVDNANYLQTNDTQTLYGIGMSVTYILNRNLRLTASYDFTGAVQNAPLASDYNRNVFLLQLKVAI